MCGVCGVYVVGVWVWVGVYVLRGVGGWDLVGECAEGVWCVFNSMQCFFVFFCLLVLSLTSIYVLFW